ncbi:HEPN domain-containing protein [Rhodococcus sp. C26F]
MANLEYVGTWWDASRPEQRVGGILTIDYAENSTLRLAGELKFDYSIYSKRQIPVIHGEASGNRVTLFVSSISNGTNYAGPVMTADVSLRPYAVVVGRHMSDFNDSLFTSITIEIDNMTTWSNFETATTRFETGKSYSTGIDFPPPASASVNVGEFTVTLQQVRQFNNITTVSYLDREKMTIDFITVAEVAAANERGIEAFDDVVHALQELLILASGYPCRMRSRKAASSHSDEEECVIYVGQSLSPKENESIDQFRFQFTLAHADFPSVFQRWMDVRKTAELGVTVLLGLDLVPQGYYESRLFSAASAIESIHRGLFPATAKSKNWTYRRRAVALAKIPDHEAVEKLLTDSEQWVKWICDARNAFAHLDYGKFEGIPEDAKFQLCYVTEALLQLVLLEKIGIPPERQRRIVQVKHARRAAVFGKCIPRKS